MAKIIFHTGDFSAAPAGVEVIGDLRATQAESSALGGSLRAPEGEVDRHVFSNCDHVLNGLRVAVGEKKVDPSDVDFIFHHEGTQQHLKLTDWGNFEQWPAHFFAQFSIDVAKLGRMRRSKRAESGLAATQ